MQEPRSAPNGRWLIIPSENRTREFDAKLLLARLAVDAGFRAIVGDRQAIHRWIADLPPSIYLAKDLRASSTRIFRILRRLGHAIVAWDEEALVYYNDAHYLDARAHGPTLQMAQALFAWGADNTRLWRASPHYRGAPIHEVGNPRLDLLRPEMRPVFAGEAAHIRKTHGDFILVNSNFGSVNHFRPDGATLSAARIESQEVQFFQRDALAYRRRLLECFLAMLPDLARNFPDRRIVVRPHPSEDQETWRRAAWDCPNVFVGHEGNVIPWLKAAGAVIHNGCTTAIEAALMGKTCIAYQPLLSPRFDIHRPNAVSRGARNMVELVAAIRMLAGDGEKEHSPVADGISSAQRRLLGAYVADIEGELSSERIVRALCVLAESGVLSPGPARGQSFARLLGHLSAGLRRRVREGRAKAAPHIADYDSHRFPTVGMGEIGASLNRIARCLDRTGGIDVREIRPGMFCLAGPGDTLAVA